MNNNDYNICGFDFTRTLPDVLKNDKNMLALGMVIAGEVQKIVKKTEYATIYARIDKLPEEILDILAYDFNVDWYDKSCTIEEKRRIFKNSVKVHKHLGTKYAVVTALRDIYPYTEVKEWFEYGGKPYMFKIIISESNDPVKQARVL